MMDILAKILSEWGDLIWLPICLITVHKGQRVIAFSFVLACALIMRLQIELMADIGFPNGVLPLITMPLYERGLFAYGLFIIAYLILSRYSKGTNQFVYIAVSISVLITAFAVSSMIMVL